MTPYHLMQVLLAGTGYFQNWRCEKGPMTCRIYYVYGGTATYTLDGVSHRFLPGHFYYLPTDLDCTLQQDPEDLFRHLFCDVIFFSPLECNTVLAMPADTPRVPLLLQTLEQTIGVLAPKRQPGFYATYFPFDDHPYYPMLCGTLLSLLRIFFKNNEHVHEIKDTEILHTVAYIHEHYQEELSVEMLAKMIFLDMNYYIKRFKTAMGTTPHAYLRQLRVSIARQLIESGANLSEAARSVGFGAATTLGRALRDASNTPRTNFEPTRPLK